MRIAPALPSLRTNKPQTGSYLPFTRALADFLGHRGNKIKIIPMSIRAKAADLPTGRAKFQNGYSLRLIFVCADGSSESRPLDELIPFAYKLFRLVDRVELASGAKAEDIAALFERAGDRDLGLTDFNRPNISICFKGTAIPPIKTAPVPPKTAPAELKAQPAKTVPPELAKYLQRWPSFDHFFSLCEHYRENMEYQVIVCGPIPGRIPDSKSMAELVEWLDYLTRNNGENLATAYSVFAEEFSGVKDSFLTSLNRDLAILREHLQLIASAQSRPKPIPIELPATKANYTGRPFEAHEIDAYSERFLRTLQYGQEFIDQHKGVAADLYRLGKYLLANNGEYFRSTYRRGYRPNIEILRSFVTEYERRFPPQIVEAPRSPEQPIIDQALPAPALLSPDTLLSQGKAVRRDLIKNPDIIRARKAAEEWANQAREQLNAYVATVRSAGRIREPRDYSIYKSILELVGKVEVRLGGQATVIDFPGQNMLPRQSRC